MIDLLLSKGLVFLEQKKNQIIANTWRASQLLEAVISSVLIRSDSFILAERFFQHELENYSGG